MQFGKEANQVPSTKPNCNRDQGQKFQSPRLALGKHIYLVHTKPSRWMGLCQPESDCKPKDYKEGDLRKKALPSLNLGCLGHHK